HPEPATEAMNRLAQALCCLSDPKAKQAYDAGLNLPITAAPEPVPAALAQPEPITVAEAPPSPADPLAWLFGPWNPPPPAPAPAAAAPATQVDWQTAPPPPVRVEVAPPAPPALIDTAATPAAATVRANVTVVEMPAVGSVAVDPLVEAVRSSPLARGLTTKRALYYRVTRTRQLLAAWDRVGRYLSQADRAVTRPAEATDLVR